MASTGKTADGTAFEIHGSENAPTVVLVHGLGLSRRLFDPMLAWFADHFQTVTYDLYGQGDSAPPPQTADLTLYSMQIKRLLTHLNVEKASVVGFSIGGMINRRFAMDFPYELNKLIIWNSPHDRGEEGQKLVEARASQVRDQGTMSTLPDALKRWFTPEFREQAPEQVDLVRQWRERVDTEGYAQAAWVLANGVRELIGPDHPIQAPALVMTCENDTGSTVQHMWQIAAELEQADVLEIPQLRHLGLMEAPEAFAKPTINFLLGKDAS